MNSTNIKNKHFSPKKRLEILLFAEKVGNVSEVCNAYSISRSTFYKWQKRHEIDSSCGLENKKKNYAHPSKIPHEIALRVITLSLDNPLWGCSRISPALKLEGISISSPTVQRVLIEEKLGTVSERLFRVEEMYLKEGLKLAPKDIDLIKRNDLCFKEIGRVGSYPGEVLVQDTFPIFKLFPNLYLHVIIDTYSSYAFAYTWPDKATDLIINVLNTNVLKFFSTQNFVVRKIITGRGYGFTRNGEVYVNFLRGNDINHEIYLGRDRNWSGFIERYKKSFFKRYSRWLDLDSDELSRTEVIQSIKNDTLHATTPINGYPNFGQSPFELIEKHKTIRNV